jgi:hypothetical protein
MATTYEISNSGLTSHKMSAKILVRLLYDGTPVRAGYNPRGIQRNAWRRTDQTTRLNAIPHVDDGQRSQLKRSASRHSPGTGKSSGLATAYGRDVTLAHACKTRIRREQSIPRPTTPVQIRREDTRRVYTVAWQCDSTGLKSVRTTYPLMRRFV